MAAARFQLTRSTQPDQPLAVRVALIRDWRKRVVCEAEADQDEQWKADLAPDKQQFWEPEWQATPALPALTRPKLIPVVTTATQANALELALTYFRRWNCQENAIRDWLIPLNLEIVCAQMTKTGLFAVWGGRDHIADLDLVVGDHHAVN